MQRYCLVERMFALTRIGPALAGTRPPGGRRAPAAIAQIVTTSARCGNLPPQRYSPVQAHPDPPQLRVASPKVWRQLLRERKAALAAEAKPERSEGVAEAARAARAAPPAPTP
jgi:hypothetical protein